MKALIKTRFALALTLTAALVSSCGGLPPVFSAPSPTPTTPAATETPTDTPTLPPPTPMAGCVVVNSLNVRAEPSKQGAVVRGLPRGTCVTVHGVDEGGTWASISADEMVGWVALPYLRLSGDPADLPVVTDLPRTEVPTDLPTATSSPTDLPTATSSPTVTPPPPTPSPTATSTSTPKPWTGLNCANTASHLGEFVQCRILHASCSYQPAVSGSPTLCTDGRYSASQFTLRVLGSDWTDLDGKCLTVNGLVVRNNGKPEIVAARRSEISICP